MATFIETNREVIAQPFQAGLLTEMYQHGNPKDWQRVVTFSDAEHYALNSGIELYKFPMHSSRNLEPEVGDLVIIPPLYDPYNFDHQTKKFREEGLKREIFISCYSRFVDDNSGLYNASVKGDDRVSGMSHGTSVSYWVSSDGLFHASVSGGLGESVAVNVLEFWGLKYKEVWSWNKRGSGAGNASFYNRLTVTWRPNLEWCETNLKNHLANHGWTEEEVNHALNNS